MNISTKFHACIRMCMIIVTSRSTIIEAFMGVIVICKNEEDPFKNEGARVVTKDLPL